MEYTMMTCLVNTIDQSVRQMPAIVSRYGSGTMMIANLFVVKNKKPIARSLDQRAGMEHNCIDMNEDHVYSVKNGIMSE